MPEQNPTPPAAPPSPPPLTGPAPVASIDELIERAEDRRIRRGSTVRVSPAHKELQTKVAMEELSDSLEACGIKLVLDKTLSGDAITVDPPAAGS